MTETKVSSFFPLLHEKGEMGRRGKERSEEKEQKKEESWEGRGYTAEIDLPIPVKIELVNDIGNFGLSWSSA